MAESYDGFISYSHAADDLLAPRLQAGLQRFAKPWWQRRALRIFRDESSLSANPHLWSSITAALDGSEWFVLLLSEDAAQSEWVNQEISYWLVHKDPSRILPVVTDGEFGWADGDVTGAAAPPALSGVFTEEPRWVNLRFARTETQLDLNNARFRDAIADVASAIRGVPKDELESEEVRQHRRTIRTAWAAGVVVLLLGVAAAVGAIVAVGQSKEARDQRDEAELQAGIARSNEQRAEELAEREAAARSDAEDARDEAQRNADEAERQRLEAEQQRGEADAQRVVAQENERIAEARSLAASALAAIGQDDDRAVLLAMAAVEKTRSVDGTVLPEALDALRATFRSHRIDARLDAGGGDYLALDPARGRVLVTSPDASGRARAAIWSYGGVGIGESVIANGIPVTGAAWSRDGRTIVTTHPDGQISVVGTFSAQIEEFLDNGVTALNPALGPEGRLLAVQDAGPVVRVWDLDRGEQLFEFGVDEPGRMAISPNGRLLAVTGSPPETDGFVTIWDIDTAALVASLPVPEDRFPRDLAWDPTSSLVAFLWDGFGGATIVDATSGDAVLEFETAVFPNAIAWSGDGLTIAVGGESRLVDLYDARTGVRRTSLAGHNSTVTALAFIGDDNPAGSSIAFADVVLASSEENGATLVWDLLADRGSGDAWASRPLAADPLIRAHYLSSDGAGVIVTSAGSVFSIELVQEFASLDARVDDPLDVAISGDGRVGMAALADDGPTIVFDTRTYQTRLALEPGLGGLALNHDGSMAVVGFSVRDLEAGGSVVEEFRVDGGFEGLSDRAFSPDSSVVALASSNGQFRVHNLETRVTRTVFTAAGEEGKRVAFSEDGTLLALAESSGLVRVIEVAPLLADASVRVVSEFVAQAGDITAMVFSPTGDLLATSGHDAVISFWKVGDGTRAFSIEHEGTPWSLDFSISGDVLMVPSGLTGRLFTYAMDLDILLRDAAFQVTRGFTENECLQFLLVDSCADAPPGTPGIGDSED